MPIEDWTPPERPVRQIAPLAPRPRARSAVATFLIGAAGGVVATLVVTLLFGGGGPSWSSAPVGGGGQASQAAAEADAARMLASQQAQRLDGIEMRLRLVEESSGYTTLNGVHLPAVPDPFAAVPPPKAGRAPNDGAAANKAAADNSAALSGLSELPAAKP